MKKLLLLLALAWPLAAQTHSVTLTWTPASSSDPNYPVTGQNVYRGSALGGPYAKIAGVGATATTYSDTNVTAGSTYYYVTAGVNSAGESGYSNEASATVPSDTTSGPSAGDIMQWNGTAWVAHTPATSITASGELEIPSREREARHQFATRLVAGSVCQVTPVSGLVVNAYEARWTATAIEVRLKGRELLGPARFAFICTGPVN
jgi:hypothetical protein